MGKSDYYLVTPMKIKPIEDKILVKLDVLKDKTEGGIFIPEKLQQGDTVAATVVDLGTGIWLLGTKLQIPFEVKVGDRVLLSTHSGPEIKDGKDRLLLIRQGDILAVITE
jgi:chaperonin GroES